MPGTTEASAASISTDRLETFSDGVLAIAATLLVLDLKTPVVGAGGLAHALTTTHAWASYAAYVVSFLVLGITWVNHHSLFDRLSQVDRPLLFLNLGLLLGLALLPFPTAVLARYLDAGGANAHAAAFLYSLVMSYVALMFSLIWWRATSRAGALLHDPMTAAAIRSSRIRFGIGVLIYTPTLGLAFYSAPLTLAVHAALAIYYAFEQLRG